MVSQAGFAAHSLCDGPKAPCHQHVKSDTLMKKLGKLRVIISSTVGRAERVSHCAGCHSSNLDWSVTNEQDRTSPFFDNMCAGGERMG